MIYRNIKLERFKPKSHAVMLDLPSDEGTAGSQGFPGRYRPAEPEVGPDCTHKPDDEQRRLVREPVSLIPEITHQPPVVTTSWSWLPLEQMLRCRAASS